MCPLPDLEKPTDLPPLPSILVVGIAGFRANCPSKIIYPDFRP